MVWTEAKSGVGGSGARSRLRSVCPWDRRCLMMCRPALPEPPVITIRLDIVSMVRSFEVSTWCSDFGFGICLELDFHSNEESSIDPGSGEWATGFMFTQAALQRSSTFPIKASTNASKSESVSQLGLRLTSLLLDA